MLWKTGVAQKYFTDLEKSEEEMILMEGNKYDEELSKESTEMSDDENESVGNYSKKALIVINKVFFKNII
jgi:hypothetical protein